MIDHDTLVLYAAQLYYISMEAKYNFIKSTMLIVNDLAGEVKKFIIVQIVLPA